MNAETKRIKSPLNILHLEDSPDDVALVQSALEAGGITCATTCVENRADFVAALEHGGIDLILSDCSVRAFDGMEALKIARVARPELPFILVSGTMGEELAIDSFKNGATDYVLKERLSQLVPAVRRAMQEVEARAEKTRLETKFIEAQKMEVVGHLAGGVAHDFNNILAIILGYCDMLTSRLDPDSPLLTYTGHIRHASERGVGLTRQLLVFSSTQTVVEPVVLDLNDVVKDMDKMLMHLIEENIEITVVPEMQIGHIKADSGYVGQVLMNLVLNARDAMPDGGKLTITTRNATLDENDLREHPGASPGEYVMLSVSDTGTGMTGEVKERLFEAFFTTKPRGKGTGLGLTTCQTIVQQSGGHIDVDSEIGKGTTIKVFFPRTGEPLEVAARPDTTMPSARGTETVLVVEDDPSVKQLARHVLESAGFEVLSASNGLDALHTAREHKGSPIRLVVTDVIMPLMDGKVMADWLKTTDPDLKILFTSGYTDDAIAKHGVLGAEVEFLSKPYPPATLVRKVREMLDAPASSSDHR
jgi:signal transduction histidine kinase